jgi:hypothetical protein
MAGAAGAGCAGDEEGDRSMEDKSEGKTGGGISPPPVLDSNDRIRS